MNTWSNGTCGCCGHKETEPSGGPYGDFRVYVRHCQGCGKPGCAECTPSCACGLRPRCMACGVESDGVTTVLYPFPMPGGKPAFECYNCMAEAAGELP